MTENQLTLTRLISEMLFNCDPAGVDFEDNYDEYDPEAEAIIPLLENATEPSDVSDIIYSVLVDFFGEDLIDPRSNSMYDAMGESIWGLIKNKA